MSKKDNDIEIGKWLSGETTKEVLSELESTSDIEAYEKIVAEVDSWSIEKTDKRSGYGKLKHQIERSATKEAKVVSFPYRLAISIAASVALLVISYFVWFRSSDAVLIETRYAEVKEITFPDGSDALLNTNSSIAYSTKTWDTQPVIELEGEAYFFGDHTKDFKVKSSKGEVTVLGTAFNIRSIKDYFTVNCYEGAVTVKIATEDSSQTLHEGQSLKFYDGQVQVDELEEKRPLWVDGNQTRFSNAPVGEVFAAIEQQFGIKLQYSKKIDLNRKYSGSFLHDNVEIALKMVCDPLGIKFKKGSGESYRIYRTRN